jgi:DNA-binding MarR family transcriptional regulator
MVDQTYLTCHRVLNTRLATLDPSVAQHEVLLTIALYPDESQSDLAARLISVKSKVSTHLRRLETRGLVQRTADAHDARNERLRLTEADEALARRSAEVQRDVVAAMLSPLSDEMKHHRGHHAPRQAGARRPRRAAAGLTGRVGKPFHAPSTGGQY